MSEYKSENPDFFIHEYVSGFEDVPKKLKTYKKRQHKNYIKDFDYFYKYSKSFKKRIEYEKYDTQSKHFQWPEKYLNKKPKGLMYFERIGAYKKYSMLVIRYRFEDMCAFYINDEREDDFYNNFNGGFIHISEENENNYNGLFLENSYHIEDEVDKFMNETIDAMDDVPYEGGSVILKYKGQK